MFDINVVKKFRDIKLDFKFKSNAKKIALFGPSGAGKTSLLKMITGFVKPDKGYIRLNDNIYF
ncbi:MAG: ATP-binding cassette domain-containing protein, partial [Deferribacterota bacterium]|nr:ATP-binding cassette domain-containing protein [Deferribacterota bacterium]